MTVSADQEEMKSNRHEEESDEKHVTNTDSPPSTTLSLSPQSNRSYMTPSPAGDFGTYSWADDPEPRPKAHPNRSFPAEPLVVLTKPLDHPDQPPKNDVVFDHHSVESHEADYDYDDDEEEEGQNDDVEAEKERSAGDGGGKSGGGLGSFNRRKLRPDLTRKAAAKTTRKSSSSSTSSHGVAKGALLGLRVCGFAFSLISLAVMASNRNQGWALDSFYRYKEFRYCFGVNLLGFIYSGFQVFDLIHFATTHKHLVQHRFRYYSDFFIDQAISYLLMSASSSASTRVEDWQSNWGKDKFPEMAQVSVGFSFAAFAALALSSIISGYMLCTAKAL